MPFKVLIAGAGPAGLEAALALHELAGDRVEHHAARSRRRADLPPAERRRAVLARDSRARYPLDAIARDFGAERVVDRLAAVDPESHVTAAPSGGDEVA